MKIADRLLCCLAFLLSGFAANAQTAQWAFRVSFTNKNGTANINNPQAFLSQRAIDRRTRMALSVDSSDLPVSPDYIDSVLTITGGKLHVTSRWFNQCVILLTDSSKIHLLENKPFFKDALLVGYFPTGLHKTKGNGKYEVGMGAAEASLSSMQRTTGNPNYYGTPYPQVQLVNGDYLHDQGLKGENMLISVIDEGFQNTDKHTGFDSLFATNRVLETYNFVRDTNYVYDYSDHGTTALSTIAGNLPGSYVGAAPYAMFALYISEIMGRELPVELDNLVAAMERADSLGTDVITCSLGYNTFDPPFTSQSITALQLDGKTTLVAKGANIATTKGILFVASVGNEGSGGLLTPGDADSALTVGAVDINKAPASFSGYGPNAAGQIKPDVCTLGNPAYVLVGSGSAVSIASGTSFATPQIAGWATCLLQSSTSSKPAVIRQAINRSADHYFNPGVQLGYGVPDFNKAKTNLGVHSVAWLVAGDFIAVHPTNFTSSINVKINANEKQSVSLNLTDMSGRTVWQQMIQAKSGVQTVNVSLPSSLPSAMYLLHAKGNSQQQTLKLIKY